MPHAAAWIGLLFQEATSSLCLSIRGFLLKVLHAALPFLISRAFHFQSHSTLPLTPLRSHQPSPWTLWQCLYPLILTALHWSILKHFYNPCIGKCISFLQQTLFYRLQEAVHLASKLVIEISRFTTKDLASRCELWIATVHKTCVISSIVHLN